MNDSPTPSYREVHVRFALADATLGREGGEMTKKNNKQKPDDPVDDYFYAAGVLIWLVLMVWGLT